MSIDSVDDLHNAEEQLSQEARGTYCRPSCIENATHGGCEDEAECACPCHERDGECDACGQTGYEVTWQGEDT